MSKSSIVKILMRRDGLTRDEAAELVVQTQDRIDALLESGVADLSEIEDVISDDLGLEPDYVMDFIGFLG